MAPALLLLVAALALALTPPLGARAAYSGTNRGLSPQILEAYNRTHYYQLVDQPVGTVVFLHGCARSARNFFPYDPVLCANCIGFAEHVSHSKQALARGYNVLALEPHDDRVLCWSSSTRGRFENDQPAVIETVSQFLVGHGLTGQPLYLWGASSGGTLALKLPGALQAAAKTAEAGAYSLKVDGIIAEVSAPQGFASDSVLQDFPPTVFVRMERDQSLPDFQANVRLLEKHGVPSGFTTSPVRQVTPEFFSDRSAEITANQSRAVVEGLRQIGLLDSDGYLTVNPHDEMKPLSAAFKWTKRLQALLPWLKPTSKTLSLVLRFSQIQQELNVAFAAHDAVSDYFTACLLWLESQGKQEFSALVEKHTIPGGKLAKLTPDRQADTLPAVSPALAPAPQEAPLQDSAPEAAPPEVPGPQSAAAPGTFLSTS